MTETHFHQLPQSIGLLDREIDKFEELIVSAVVTVYVVILGRQQINRSLVLLLQINSHPLVHRPIDTLDDLLRDSLIMSRIKVAQRPMLPPLEYLHLVYTPIELNTYHTLQANNKFLISSLSNISSTYHNRLRRLARQCIRTG
jgi:hypothetical protein